MSKQACVAQAPGLSAMSDGELRAAIAALEIEHETLDARRCVLRRRIAILRAERLARTRGAHFDVTAAAETVLRRLRL